ncbi:hypothetical protein [Cellulosilyticum ruminicola]|uniref:hypothetical protein n=1 Tax=Cellulosilyticum ruminicola TaxID=425254 RepID=UPI0006D29ED6|nr:hypothetical protein [Cellulosilyticum ruminicola]
MVPGSPMMLTCERCGASILTGKYCNKCKAELVGELSVVAHDMTSVQKKLEHTEKMRFLKSDRIH